MIYSLTPLSRTQRLNALFAGDPHLDPVPRAFTLPGAPRRPLRWDDRALPKALREELAHRAILAAAPALDLLMKARWLDMPRAIRHRIVEITRDNPRGMFRLLQELDEAGIDPETFLKIYSAPTLEAPSPVANPIPLRLQFGAA